MAGIRSVALRWFGRALIVLAVVGGGLLACEYYLRAYYPVREIIQVDERVLYKPIPNTRRRFFRRDGGSVLVSINAEGRRGPLASKENGTKNVVVYGDSFIFGAFSPEEETFATQLAQDLAATSADPVQVLNAGVDGYGPDQILRRMSDDLDVLKPDLCVVAIFPGNDFGDLIRDKLYRLDPSDGRLVENQVVIGPALMPQTPADMAKGQPSWQIVTIIDKFLERRRHAQGKNEEMTEIFKDTNRAFGKFEQDAAREYEDYMALHPTLVTNLYDDGYDADIALHPDAPASIYKKRLMEAVLVRMKAEADAQHVPLLLCIIPAALDTVERYDPAMDGAVYSRYRRSELTDAVASIAQRHSIPYVDLFAAFRGNEPASLYFEPWDGHWNAKGQALAAREVAGAIASLGLLRTRDSSPQAQAEN